MTRENWARHIQGWRASGLLAKDYARRERLNVSTLRWWSSRLRHEGTTLPAFVELAVNQPAPSDFIEVAIGERVRVHIRRGFDAELLRQVVAALEGR
jgi:hypothetical protein